MRELTKSEDVTIANWNLLRKRFMNDLRTKRSEEEVESSIDKEFIRFYNSLKRGVINELSFKILKFGVIDFPRGYVYLKTPSGFTIRFSINSETINLLAYWVTQDPEEKVIRGIRWANIDGRGYQWRS